MKLIRKLIERLKNQQGVTLIELLAVIVILGIIAAIGVPALMDSREQAQKETYNTNSKIMTEAAKRKLLMGQKYAESVSDDDVEFNLDELLSEANIGHGDVTEATVSGDDSDAEGSATAYVDESDDSKGIYELDVASGTVTFNAETSDEAVEEQGSEDEAVEEEGNDEGNSEEDQTLQPDENLDAGEGQSLDVEREEPAQPRQ